MEQRAPGLREEIPNKLYFRIGEVSEIVGVKPYVLRYWESEFPDIKPSKSKSGQRLYKRRDVEVLLLIKQLLYHERFTINGARRRLKDAVRGDGSAPPGEPEQLDAFAAPEESDLPVAPPTSERARPNGEARLDRPMPAAIESAAPAERRKVMQKLRKDLEYLLHLIREA